MLKSTTNGLATGGEKTMSRHQQAEARGRGWKSGSCLDEEILESYLLQRLPGQQRGDAADSEVERVELHLLVCESCQDRAMRLEAQLRELCAALRQWEKSAKPKTFAAGASAWYLD